MRSPGVRAASGGMSSTSSSSSFLVFVFRVTFFFIVISSSCSSSCFSSSPSSCSSSSWSACDDLVRVVLSLVLSFTLAVSLVSVVDSVTCLEVLWYLPARPLFAALLPWSFSSSLLSSSPSSSLSETGPVSCPLPAAVAGGEVGPNPASDMYRLDLLRGDDPSCDLSMPLLVPLFGAIEDVSDGSGAAAAATGSALGDGDPTTAAAEPLLEASRSYCKQAPAECWLSEQKWPKSAGWLNSGTTLCQHSIDGERQSNDNRKFSAWRALVPCLLRPPRENSRVRRSSATGCCRSPGRR